MAVSLRLNEREEKLFREYAKMHQMTLSELIRFSVLKTIENEHDMDTYHKALELYEKSGHNVMSLKQIKEG